MRLRTRTKLMVQLAQDVISAEDNENYLLDQGYDSSPAPSLDVSFDIDDDLDGSFKDPTYVPSVSSLITKDGYNDIDCSPETSLKQDFANNEEIKNSPEREIKKIFYMNDGFNSNEKKYILDLPVANKSANKINIIDDVVLKKSCTGTNPVIDFADKLNSSRPSCNVRLPQDIYQTAKISKLLLLMERGVDIYKGKSLHEIDINPQEELAEEESENDDDTQNIHSVAVPNSLVKPQHKQHIELKSEIIGRTAWTAEQAGLVKTYFENNISSKKAPRKKECLELINKYPDVFYNKDWTRVKTFIYNIYRKK
ncbi:uncharacterized protein isoform X2 [Leptinotarsa decemlineata]|uniref:uncharacterized protein isoform X2 n=1 Tax=Leptinotarsa decemlineata TaxID=7539 RepID=UPI003D30BEF1